MNFAKKKAVVVFAEIIAPTMNSKVRESGASASVERLVELNNETWTGGSFAEYASCIHISFLVNSRILLE